jgi:hypothetical protein
MATYPKYNTKIVERDKIHTNLTFLVLYLKAHRMLKILGMSPGQVKPKTIKLIFVAYPLNIQHLVVIANTTDRFGISRICPSGMTCLSADDCFSVLFTSLHNEHSGCLTRNGKSVSFASTCGHCRSSFFTILSYVY